MHTGRRMGERKEGREKERDGQRNRQDTLK